MCSAVIAAASRGAFALAVLLAVLGCVPGTAAAGQAEAGTAVVLVSGFTSTTPFTTSAPACAGQEGGTWDAPTGAAAALKQAGYTVFTAPVAADGKTAPPCVGAGQPAPPASATIDSDGELSANGQALLELLAFLRESYGISSVQVLAHSDGGLWSRSAITQLPSSRQALPTVQSLMTLGTPHTGSFGADLAEYVRNGQCDASNRVLQELCELMLPVLDDLIKDLGPEAVKELSSSFLDDWNRQQSIGCPVTVVGGTYAALPSWIGWLVPEYYNPSDGIVGEASAVNVASFSVTGAAIPAAPLAMIAGGTFPVVHTGELSFLGTANTLVNYPPITAVVLQSIGATGSGAPCAEPSGEGAGGGPAITTANARFGTLLAPDRRGRVAGARDGDVALLIGRRPRVTCRGRTHAGTPLLGSRRLRYVALPRCGRAPVVRDGRALVVRPDRAGRRLVARLRGGRLAVRLAGHGLRRVRFAVEDGRGWRRAPRGRARVRPDGPHVAVRATGRDRRGRRFAAVVRVAAPHVR